MARIVLAIFSAILFVSVCVSEDMQVGTSINNELAHVENVKLTSIPLKTRTKNVFYNNEKNPKIIKGISAIDLDKTKATARVTAGGVGSTFANVKLKSERGEGLNYQLQFFV